MRRSSLLLPVVLAGLVACGCPEREQVAGPAADAVDLGLPPPGGASSASRGAPPPPDFPCSARCKAVFGPELARANSATSLVKHHLLPALQAGEVREALGPGVGSARGFGLVGDLAEDLYLAAPELAALDAPPSFTEAELKSRYERDRDRWLLLGRVAFVQAQLLQDTPEAEVAARAAVRELLAVVQDGREPFKRTDELVVLNYEPLRPIAPGDRLYELVGQPVGAIVGPLGSGAPVVAVVTASEPETYRPLHEVRSQIEAELVQEELERRRRELLDRAARAFPVALERGYARNTSDVGEVFGRLGSQPIDRDLMVATQSLSPSFHLERDPAAFEPLLLEHCAAPRMLAAAQRQEGVHEAPGVVEELAVVRRIAEDRLLACRWPLVVAGLVEADGSRPREWYEEHPDRFSVPGDVDLLIAYLPTTSTQAAVAARAELEIRADRGEFGQGPKFRGDGFIITWEPQVTARVEPVLYAAASEVDIGEVAGPVPFGDGTALLLPTRRTPDGLMPFEDAREECLARVIQEETDARLDTLRRRARAMVPSGFE